MPKHNHPRGSLWRQWDLHFHTPASFDYSGGGPTNGQLVDALVGNGIGVVAVTDHHVMDVPRIRELAALGEGRLTVLPGIELRSELGSKPVHYIAIFPEDADLDHVWDTLRGELKLTPKAIADMGGDDRVYVPLSTGYACVEALGGIISIHAGAKSNSIEGINNAEQFQQRIKYDIARKYVSLLEVGQLKDLESYQEIIFPRTKLSLPIIVGSDNHNIQEYTFLPRCWIKADPTFVGLRQVLNEPIDRVFLGEQPPQLEYVAKHPTKYIDQVDISRRTPSGSSEIWFDGVSVQLNPGLVAVIGNQGSGKSALTDILGLLGNSKHEESFAFLNSEHFRHPKRNRAIDFNATLTWSSGSFERANLNDHGDATRPEFVQYIPQFHLDEICDELTGGQAGKFDRELKAVIFSRIPQGARQKAKSLEELIAARTREARERVQLHSQQLPGAVERLVNLERMATADHRRSLEEQLKVLQTEIAAHQATKPQPVEPPNEDAAITAGLARDREEIGRLTEEIEALTARVSVDTASLEEVERKLELVRQTRGRLRTFETTFATLRSELSGDFQTLGIDTDAVVGIRIDLQPLAASERELTGSRDRLLADLAADGTGRPVEIRAKVERRNELRQQLDKPAKDYERYKDEMTAWEKRLRALQGDPTKVGTEEYLKGQIGELVQVPGLLKKAKEDLKNVALNIFDAKTSILTVYEELHAPVQEFIDTHPLARQRFGLEFRVASAVSGFTTKFLDHIDQGRRGSFYGEPDGRERLNGLLAAADFSSPDGVSQFLEQIDSHLHHDCRSDEDPRPKTDLFKQLRKDYTAESIYSYVYGLEYLQPRYELRWHGKPLEQLSPGERGTLLLLFFLLIDKSETPLIIDQPEGNLDNQTVYELLVDCIKEAKTRRQIIIVTHNPNLAVVCDAEQVIYAHLDKADHNRVTYVSGSLENPVMCGHIVDILEGTRPAIDNRVAKYKIIFDTELASGS